MSDQLYPLAIEELAAWMVRELKHDRLFGIHRSLWFEPNPHQPFRMERYGQLLETPIGVAAGPHTQLSQNIIAAWLTGARYIELKTVQTLDAIAVTKPCIDMTDEGYNCEWSQELRLQQSFSEYLNAWILIHWLRHQLKWDTLPDPGFIFNMSVGYDLAGILNPNVQQFLDEMTACPLQLAEKLDRLRSILPGLDEINIPDSLTNNITLSTMHGCPPGEIERIGKYLMEERQLHTTIKLNPTLLGPDRLREVLHDRLGFDSIRVPDAAFEHDLRYGAAVELIKSLQASAEQTGIQFGIKLTNTLEVENVKGNLPGQEPLVYLSGRALHPISVLVASRLQTDFDGQLDINFSAGADAFNVAEILECNIRPVTVCSDLLKPGGYARLRQYLDILNEKMSASGARNMTEFILARTDGQPDITQAGLSNLRAYAESVPDDERYQQRHFPYASIKTNRALSVFDCIAAPCVNECAVDQDIPGYMYSTAQGGFDQALEVILRNNPFPHVAGLVCDHLCQSKCTRLNYDRPLLIRSIKHFIAEQADDRTDPEAAPFNGLTVAVIGGGPAGLSAAYFLALDGFKVEIFEAKPRVGGMTADAIPSFRLDEAGLQADVERIQRLGVGIHTTAAISSERFTALRHDFDFLFIAVGAQQGRQPGIPGEKGANVWDQLTFLRRVNHGERPDLGQSVLIIGGGNSAMDAARTAKRVVGAQGKVTVVYRRTRTQMPADRDEVAELAPEGIDLLELAAPVEVIRENERMVGLRCKKMQLGEIDASGRRRPVPIPGSTFDLAANSIIFAIGQEVVLDFFPDRVLKSDPVTLETQISDVFAGGDVVRGPATLIQAIGDGRAAALAISRKAGITGHPVFDSLTRHFTAVDFQQKQAVRDYGPPVQVQRADEQLGFSLLAKSLNAATAQAEAGRCLYCDEYCSVCVGVCPNRANVEFQMPPRSLRVLQGYVRGEEFSPVKSHLIRTTQVPQIMTIGDFCNECGNCTTFCPTAGEPYRVKPKFWLSAAAYHEEQTGYHFDDGLLRHQTGQGEATLRQINGRLIYTDDQVTATFEPANFKLLRTHAKQPGRLAVDFSGAANMYQLWSALKSHPLFCKSNLPDEIGQV